MHGLLQEYVPSYTLKQEREFQGTKLLRGSGILASEDGTGGKIKKILNELKVLQSDKQNYLKLF